MSQRCHRDAFGTGRDGSAAVAAVQVSGSPESRRLPAARELLNLSPKLASERGLPPGDQFFRLDADGSVPEISGELETNPQR